MLSTALNDRKTSSRLLCVDDDPRFLMVFAALLESAGYVVEALSDPRLAVELACRTAFDLVILDYDMPHMNGAELACQLKEQKRDLPIVLFSGNPSPPAEALNVIDAYVVKGQGIGSLLRTLSATVHAQAGS